MALVTIPYSPRRAFIDFHARTQRWSCLVVHRRGGKTVACINELIRAACQFTKYPNGRFAYVAPQYSQAKDIAWGYVKQFTGAIPGIAYNESELRVDFPNGARVRLYGAENESRLRGLYLDGVILDEYADIHPRVFDEIIRPLLSDRHGWAVFIGTPCGHDAFYDTYQKALVNTEDWYSIMLKASTSGILDPDEMEAMKKEMSEDAYAQELECSFEAAIKGAVFGKEMQVAETEGRITTVPWDPGSEVWTGWDLGIGDATAIWFCQQVGREPRLIDFYQARGASIDHYVKVLKDKPYAYARHLLPHDADKTELGSGQSIIEQLKGMGIRNTRVVKKLTISERIEIGRKFVRMCWFDRVKTGPGVEALKVWRYEYDALAGVNSKKPIHNWACFHPDTKVLTRYGTHRIIDLPLNGEVLTPCGWKRYEGPRLTKKAVQLVQVEFTNGSSVKCTPDHLFQTMDGWKSAASLMRGTLIQSCSTRSPNISMAGCIAFIRKTRITLGVAKPYIAQLGQWLSAPFRRAVTFITGTATPATTGFQISSASTLPSIWREYGITGLSPNQYVIKLPNGTVLKPGGYGTVVTQGAQKAGSSGNAKTCRAPSAVKSFWDWFVRALEDLCIVLPNVVPLQVERVSNCVEVSDVYCINVPDVGCFSLANGAVVSNSHPSDAFTYLAVGFRPESMYAAPIKYPNLAIP